MTQPYLLHLQVLQSIWERRDQIVQNVGLNDTTLPPSPPSLTFIPPLPYFMYKMSGQISIHHTSWFHWERRDCKLSGQVLSFTYKMGAEGQNVGLNQYAPYLLHLQNASIYNTLTLQLRRSLQVKWRHLVEYCCISYQKSDLEEGPIDRILKL